ncbi:helix-turn-helix domain-containing protein [Streptomyces sp. NPDC008092]|uniref:PucR family transcriptional regulator n=1 Tax=Streptomyces sp. NPDC008092 TaxID=3364808 RepID=UPI0036EBEB55
MSLSSVGTALLARLPEIGGQMAARIRSDVDTYRDASLVPPDSLVDSCIRNAGLVLGCFAHGDAPDVRSAWETGRIRAENGVPLADTLHAYRIAFELLWALMREEAGGHPEVTEADLLEGSSVLWTLFGRYAEGVATAYREKATELTSRAEARRSALAEALFTGVIADPATLGEAAGQLGLPEHGPYVVIAAAVSGGPGAEPLPGIEAALREVHVASTWRLLPEAQIGLVSLDPTDARSMGLRVLRRSRARIGTSPRFDSLRDTPKALRFARLALAGLPGTGPGLARFDDNPLAMLAAAAPSEAARLVELVLTPVLGLPTPERARLLETLGQWFAAGGSAAEVAARMFVHPNTVRYRIRRIEELTGRRLSDPRAVAEIGAALHTLHVLPR